MINYRFGDIDANGAALKADATALQAQCQAILPNMLAASGFWARCWSTAVRHPVGPRELQVVDVDPNPKGQRRAHVFCDHTTRTAD